MPRVILEDQLKPKAALTFGNLTHITSPSHNFFEISIVVPKGVGVSIDGNDVSASTLAVLPAHGRDWSLSCLV
jgi:hypothetical protein